MFRGGGFSRRFWHGEDAKGCEVHSGGYEENDNCSLLRKSRLDSSSFVGDIHKKGQITNAFVPFDTTFNAIFSSMGFRVG